MNTTDHTAHIERIDGLAEQLRMTEELRLKLTADLEAAKASAVAAGVTVGPR